MQSRGQDYREFGGRRARNRGARMGAIFFVLMMAAAAGAGAGQAQRTEKCNESIVKKKSLTPVTESAAEDIYANTSNSKGPVKGKKEVEALRAATMAERKNSKPAIFLPDKIVTSKAGDIAYDYGKAHVEYDLASTGQHIAYDVEYMRVWKVNGGVCQIEGIFSRADKLSEINK
jgi:hypothetical protein